LTLCATIYIVPRTITEPMLLVLAALIGGPKHGYALICDIEQQTGKRLGPGTLYGILGRLERYEYVRALEIEERGRRPYRITAAGKRAFETRMRTLQQYQRALRSLAGL
jgi:DNA-binding PadR family transcriptional regulator